MGQSECSLSLFSVIATLPSTAPRNPSHSLADTHTRATRRARTRVMRVNVRLLREIVDDFLIVRAGIKQSSSVGEWAVGES